MTIFGIPLFISYDYLVNFISENFPLLTLTDGNMLTIFFIVNFFYILLILCFLRFLLFVLDFLLNRIFRRHRRF